MGAAIVDCQLKTQCKGHFRRTFCTDLRLWTKLGSTPIHQIAIKTMDWCKCAEVGEVRFVGWECDVYFLRFASNHDWLIGKEQDNKESL